MKTCKCGTEHSQPGTLCKKCRSNQNNERQKAKRKENKFTLISFQAEQDLNQKLEFLKEKTGASKSFMLKKACTEYLNKELSEEEIKNFSA